MADPYGGTAGLIEGGGTGSHKKKKRPTPPPPQQPREPQQTPGPGGGSQPTTPGAPPYTPQPQAPRTQPDYQRPGDAYHAMVRYNLNQRISLFPQHIVQQAPFLVAGLAFSGAPNEQLAGIAQGLQSSWSFVTQGLDPATVQRLINAASGPDLGIHGVTSTMAALGITKQGPQTGATQAVAGVANEQAGLRAVRWLGALAGQEGWVPYANREPTTGLDWINQRIYDLTQALQGKDPQTETLMDPRLRQAYLNSPGGLATISEVELASAPFALASKALRVGGQGLEQIPGIGHPLHQGIEGLLYAPSKAFQWVGGQANEIGTKVATLSGAKPGTFDFQAIQSATAFIVQWELGKGVASTAAALKIGLTEPHEVLYPKINSAELRAAAKESGLRGVNTPGANLAESFSPNIIGVRGPAARLHGRIAQFIARAVNQKARTFYTVGLGRRFVNAAWKVVTKPKYQSNVAGALRSAFPGMTDEIANALSGARTREEIASTMQTFMEKPLPAEVNAYKGRLREIDAKLVTTLTDSERADLMVERLSVNRWLRNLKPDEPIFRTPKSSTIRRIRTGTTLNPVETLLHHIYDVPFGIPLPTPGGFMRVRPPRLSQAFEDMAQEPLYPPGPNSPADFRARNAETVQKVLSYAGVKQGRILAVVDRLTKAQTEHDWFQVMYRDFSSALADSKYIAPDMRQMLARRIQGVSFESRHQSFLSDTYTSADGATIVSSEDLLHRIGPDGQRYPQPSETAQLISHPVPIPSPELMTQATSYLRTLARGMRRTYKREPERMGVLTSDRRLNFRVTPQAVAARMALLPFDLIHGVLDFSTAVFKPLTLITRPVSMPLRIQLEEGLRNYFMGYEPLIVGKSGAFKEALRQESVRQAIGFIGRESIEPAGTIMERFPLDLTDWRNGAAMQEGELAQALDAIHTRINMMRQSPEVQELLSRGADGFVEWATGPTARATSFRRNFAPIFDTAEQTKALPFAEQARVWADRKMREINDVTGGDPTLQQAIVSGRWSQRGADVQDAIRSGLGDETRQQQFDRLNERVTELNDLIKNEPSAKARRALQDARRKDLKDLDRLEAQGWKGNPNLRGPLPQDIPLDKADDFKAALLDAKNSGDWTPPLKVMIDKKTINPDAYTAAQQLRSGISRFLYRGLAPATFADIHGMRGSHFYQAWRRHYSELAARYGTGDTEYLKNQAMWRAARETSDLHYDLAARTPLQRALRNIFWFMPAYQEVLTTWLIKIPSRYVPGVGHLYLYNQVNALSNLLHSTGIIQKGPPSPQNPEGSDRIVLPFAAPFFANLFPGSQLSQEGNRTIISISPSSLNLVFSGFPTVSQPVAITLGNLGRKYGGTFKSLNDVLTYHGIGADTTIGPSSLNYAYTAITGRPPPWEFFSQDYQNDQFSLAFHEAEAMAYYSLSKEGIKPPVPEDFPTTKAYGDAKFRYYTRWHNEAKQIVQGWYAIKAFGGMFSPAALHVTTQYQEEVARVWDKITGGKPLTAGLTPEQASIIENWRAEHPEGLAYTVGRTQRTTPTKRIPGVPFDPSVMQEVLDFGDQLWSNARQVLDTAQDPTEGSDAFMRRVATYNSNAHYAAKKADLYKGLTAPEILMRYYAIHQKLEDINTQQAVWKDQNPVAQGEWQQWIRSFSQSDMSQSPAKLLETERLGQLIHDLNSAADLFTSGGIRDTDWKRVLSRIQGYYSETSDFGPPRTDVEKNIAWYIDRVVSPYMAQVLPLYDKADQLSAAGLTDAAGQVYTDIRHINDTFSAGKIVGPYDGLTYPNPEDYFFAHLSPHEQKIRVLHWQTEPTGWLTNFQREKTGIGADPKYGRMFDLIEKFNADTVQAYIDQNNISPGSKWDDSVQQWAQDQIHQWVQKRYGNEGLRVYALSQAAPYKRLQAVGFGTANPTWEAIVRSADYVTKMITTPWPTARPDIHYSPEGDTSATQQYYKTRLFDAIDNLRAKDPNGPLDRLFTNLSYATAGQGRDYREGPSLYDALFFNHFGPTSIVPSNPDVYRLIGPGGDQATQTNGASPFADFHPAHWSTTYRNGYIPLTSLVQVGTGNTPYATSGGYYMRPDAAMSFLRMQQAAKRDGVDLAPFIANAYRTYDQQVQIAHTINPATGRPVQHADPGSSDHGWGLAFDFKEGPNTDSAGRILPPVTPGQKAWTWFYEHSARYGWINAVYENALKYNTWSSGDTGHWSFAFGGATGGGSDPTYGIPRPEDHYWIRQARNYVPGEGVKQPTTVKEPQGLDNTTANRNLAKTLAFERGWTGKQWTALRWIVEGHGGVPAESNWRGSATNPSSGAFGIGQRYLKPNPYTSPQEQQQYETSVRYQIEWMLNYIQQRYGDPLAAWQYKASNGGY